MNLTRKNKARLAFEMLEKEFEVLSEQEMRGLKGGTMYRYSTNPLTGAIERYYSNSNGMSWYKDFDFYGGQDSEWSGPVSMGGSSTGITDNGLGILVAYENYLNGRKYSGNNLTTNQQKFNNAIDAMIGELIAVKTSSCFDVTIGYGKDDKGRIIMDSKYAGSTVANGNTISVLINKEFGEGVYNYGLIAHELDHVYRYFTGGLIQDDANSYTKEDEYEAYKRQLMLKYSDYFDREAFYNRQAFDIVNQNYSGGKEGFPTLQWSGAPPFGSTGNGGSTGNYGSSGIISTGYEGDTYWENFYVYEENGPYTAGEQSWGYAALNYSTGYNYSTGSSTGSGESTENSTGY